MQQTMFSEDLFAKLSAQLINALALDQPPVAICFAETVPDGMQGPAARVPAGCRFWEDATTSTFATKAADHNLCAIGVHTHNLETSPAQQVDLMDALKVFGDLGYVTPEDLPLIPVLESRPKHVVYSPLASTPLAPDVVLLFVDANQTLILSEATQQVEQQHAPAMGRPACAVVPQVMNSGRAALSLGCCGARAYLNILPDSKACSLFRERSWRVTSRGSWRWPMRTRCCHVFIRCGGKRLRVGLAHRLKSR